MHPGALGDVVAAFPALIALKDDYRRIDAACRSGVGRLAADIGAVRAGFPLENAIFASLHGRRPDRRLVEFFTPYDDIILFSFSEEMAEGVKQVFKKNVHQIPPRPRPQERRHVTEHIFEGLIRRGRLHIPESEINKTITAITAEDRRASGVQSRSVLIHPGSGSRKKNWPLKNFLELSKKLGRRGVETAFLLGPAEEFMASALIADLGSNLTVHSPPDASALLSLLKTVGGFAGNDSGVSHLAAFLGLPTVAVFGPSDPVRWRPLGRAVAVVTSDSCCPPCFELDNVDCDSRRCLNGASVDMVFKAFLKIIKL